MYQRDESREPLLLACRYRSDGGFVFQGKDLLKTLHGAGKGTAVIGNTAISLKLLREVARLFKDESLVLYPRAGGERLVFENIDSRPHSKLSFKNGAGDKSQGFYGYDVEVRFAPSNISLP